MGIWDSIKRGASNMSRLSELESKLRNNQNLTNSELAEFEQLSKSTLNEIFEKKPGKFFKGTSNYGQISIDENKQLFKLNTKVYHFENLNTYELLENESSISSGGLGIGRAIVGGALVGSVGAVIGGTTKRRKNTNIVESLKIFISFKGIREISTTLPFITKKQKKDKKYEKQLVSAKETLAGLDYISNFMNNQIQSNQQVNTTQSNSADEIRQYMELLNDGIITPQEFEYKKNEILNRRI
ncbi:SHOCT domain-containing protein [Companilactobacillus allii]|uniref:SHOCT domain-containing protein n=1 Tax=Companilactobacillus allii TaxID=1847728 RepID=A0A1P8Q5N5_9LACO|nr:SHOCT domain-containing protein [Companilactobacillus allii]APX73158.1 hypothetical protein BTM29_11615 [Companilactobacillus allii]USQ67965.1 SHOCT domain-containing protein [Companilactobacillus allii]